MDFQNMFNLRKQSRFE